jgi:hypothetical protein
MPLPDADKRSPRVYTLLQNLDLENITADTLADVADPIAIEEANEDELRRLCLVAFARMVTKGSFDGWLTSAGGGNEFNGELTKYNWDGDADPIRVLALGPYGTTERVHNNSDIQDGKLSWFPFISPYTGTVSEVDLYIGGTSGGTGSVDIGFYSDDDGVPKTFMGEFVVDVHTSTGVVTQTTSSSDVDLTRGTQYWMGMYANNWASQANFTANEIQSSGSSALQTSPNGISGIHSAMVMTTSGNATVTDWTALSPSTSNPINVGVKF